MHSVSKHLHLLEFTVKILMTLSVKDVAQWP